MILIILVLIDFCDRIRPAGPAQRAGAVPRAPYGQPHVDAGAQQSAADG